jgi:hypothetical protein
MTEKQLNYPYAYGHLDTGVRLFSYNFGVKARKAGFVVGDDLVKFLQKELTAMSDDTRSRAENIDL